MNRRMFLGAGFATLPLEAAQVPSPLVSAGADRFGKSRGLGFSSIAFKVSSHDSDGDLFIFEHSNLSKGGPPRHLHFGEDEWLYALEGEFRVEVGTQKHVLKPGGSILMPRKVPHVWAYTGASPGRLLIVFAPANKMEAFFSTTAKGLGSKPSLDPAFLRSYGIELLGPPLKL